MKDLKRRYKKLFPDVGYISVEDTKYHKNDFEKWAVHSLKYWYEVEEPIDININTKELEQEMDSLENLVNANSLEEWFEL